MADLGAEAANPGIYHARPTPQAISSVREFTGKGDAYAWLSCFDRLADLYDWTEEDCLRVAQSRMTDAAQQWLQNKQFTGWEQFRDKFKKRFGESPQTAIARIENCYQESGESPQQFLDRYLYAASRAGYDENSQVMLHEFVQRLNPDLFTEVVRKQLGSMEEVVSFCNYWLGITGANSRSNRSSRVRFADESYPSGETYYQPLRPRTPDIMPRSFSRGPWSGSCPGPDFEDRHDPHPGDRSLQDRPERRFNSRPRPAPYRPSPARESFNRAAQSGNNGSFGRPATTNDSVEELRKQFEKMEINFTQTLQELGAERRENTLLKRALQQQDFPGGALPQLNHMMSYHLGIQEIDDESEDEWMASIFAKYARHEADDVYQRTPSKRVAFDPSNSPWAPRPPQPARPSQSRPSTAQGPAFKASQEKPSHSATPAVDANRRMPRNQAAFNVPSRDTTNQAQPASADKGGLSTAVDTTAFDPSNSPWAPRPPQPARPSQSRPSTAQGPAFKASQEKPSHSATPAVDANRRMPRNRAAFNVPSRDTTNQAQPASADKGGLPTAVDTTIHPAAARSVAPRTYGASEEASAKLAEDLGREMSLTISKNVRIDAPKAATVPPKAALTCAAGFLTDDPRLIKEGRTLARQCTSLAHKLKLAGRLSRSLPGQILMLQTITSAAQPPILDEMKEHCKVLDITGANGKEACSQGQGITEEEPDDPLKISKTIKTDTLAEESIRATIPALQDPCAGMRDKPTDYLASSSPPAYCAGLQSNLAGSRDSEDVIAATCKDIYENQAVMQWLNPGEHDAEKVPHTSREVREEIEQVVRCLPAERRPLAATKAIIGGMTPPTGTAAPVRPWAAALATDECRMEAGEGHAGISIRIKQETGFIKDSEDTKAFNMPIAIEDDTKQEDIHAKPKPNNLVRSESDELDSGTRHLLKKRAMERSERHNEAEKSTLRSQERHRRDFRRRHSNHSKRGHAAWQRRPSDEDTTKVYRHEAKGTPYKLKQRRYVRNPAFGGCWQGKTWRHRVPRRIPRYDDLPPKYRLESHGNLAGDETAIVTSAIGSSGWAYAQQDTSLKSFQ